MKNPDKIARTTLIRDYQKGGLRAIDVNFVMPQHYYG